MSNIVAQYNVENTQSVFEMKANIYRLISLIIKNKDDLYIEENSFNKNKDVITEIFDYIDNNYMNNFTVRDISGYIHLSIPHFMRVFKNATGMTFKHYLNFYRINKSTKILLQGNSVSKVALDCGFENINTFIRLFKEFKNTTPTGYIKMNLK
jgi:AraC-like DNA-binding protein